MFELFELLLSFDKQKLGLITKGSKRHQNHVGMVGELN
jgi:hypothetical protein